MANVMRWCLRELMAGQGMRASTDLIAPMEALHIRLKRHNAWRLVDGSGQKLPTLNTINALCTILHCSPNELFGFVEVETAPTGARRAARARATFKREKRQTLRPHGAFEPVPADLRS